MFYDLDKTKRGVGYIVNIEESLTSLFVKFCLYCPMHHLSHSIIVS